MTRLLGENPPEELRNALSLELAVKPETPPSFLWHTADDGAVPVENSLMYAKALSKRASRLSFMFSGGPAWSWSCGRRCQCFAMDGLCAGWLQKIGFLSQAVVQEGRTEQHNLRTHVKQAHLKNSDELVRIT